MTLIQIKNDIDFEKIIVRNRVILNMSEKIMLDVVFMRLSLRSRHIYIVRFGIEWSEKKKSSQQKPMICSVFHNGNQ